MASTASGAEQGGPKQDKRAVGRAKNHWLWAGLKITVIVVVYTFVSIAGWKGLPVASGGCALQEDTHTSIMDRVYGPISHWGAYTPAKTKVVEVIIDPASAPMEVTTNTCKGRYFMAALLETLKKYSPRVIAVDKMYGANSCTEEGPNKALTAAFRDVLLVGNLRLVVGQATETRSAVLPDDIDCLVKTPAVDFNQRAHLPPARQILSGLTRLNHNTLKIPLSWWTYPSPGAVNKLTDAGATSANLEKTFSYVAAEQAGLPDDEKSSQLDDGDGEHPYARFPRRPLQIISAMELVCPTEQSALRKQGIHLNCTPGSTGFSDFSLLAGHTVVIGEHVESDKRFLADQQIYGVDLQADYIEALLDGGYVHQSVNWDRTLLASFVLGTAIIAGMERFKHLSSWKALLWSTALFVALAAACLWLFEEADAFTPDFFLASGAIALLLLTQFLQLLLHTQFEQTAHQSEGDER